MSDRKTKFYWASVAGADPEPVEVCTVEGRRACYTLGCADPFFLDEPNCPVRLGSAREAPWSTYHDALVLHFKKVKPMPRPKLPNEAQTAYIVHEDRPDIRTLAYVKRRARLARPAMTLPATLIAALTVIAGTVGTIPLPTTTPMKKYELTEIIPLTHVERRDPFKTGN